MEAGKKDEQTARTAVKKWDTLLYIGQDKSKMQKIKIERSDWRKGRKIVTCEDKCIADYLIKILPTFL